MRVFFLCQLRGILSCIQQRGACAPLQLLGCLVGVLLLHARILLDGLRGNRGRGLGAVAYLRVGRGRADGSPCLA